MKERRVLYSDQLRSLCIAKSWYTHGDCAEYSKMLEMCGDGMKDINIMRHSRDDERELESYCYEIAEITHTFFESEYKLKEVHKDIIFDICMNINNCANCYNEETRQTDCYFLQCVETYDLSENSFCIEPYGEKTNKILCSLADRYGYKYEFMMDGKEIALIKFERQ